MSGSAEDEPLFVDVDTTTVRVRARVRSVDRSVSFDGEWLSCRWENEMSWIAQVGDEEVGSDDDLYALLERVAPIEARMGRLEDLEVGAAKKLRAVDFIDEETLRELAADRQLTAGHVIDLISDRVADVVDGGKACLRPGAGLLRPSPVDGIDPRGDIRHVTAFMQWVEDEVIVKPEEVFDGSPATLLLGKDAEWKLGRAAMSSAWVAVVRYSLATSQWSWVLVRNAGLSCAGSAAKLRDATMAAEAEAARCCVIPTEFVDGDWIVSKPEGPEPWAVVIPPSRGSSGGWSWWAQGTTAEAASYAEARSAVWSHLKKVGGL